MLDRIKKWILKHQKLKPTFDVSFINDEIAHKTSWTSLRGGGANFRTRKLNQISPTRIEWAGSLGMKLFAAIFSVPAIAFLVIYLSFGSSFKDQSNHMLFILVPFVFLIASLIMWYFMMVPVVFDKRSGFYWRGWQHPPYRLNEEISPKFTKLIDIHAIQIVSEYISSDNGGYESYELNLILIDASRKNVVDHGDYKRLILDAEILADFLNVPIWDAVQSRVRSQNEKNQSDLLLNNKE